MQAHMSTANEKGGAAVRLFCFPAAGGRSSSMNAWIRHLPPEVGLERMELPGREPEAVDRRHASMESLIPEVWHTIASRLDRPFVLYGHSVGALVAYEVALRAMEFGDVGPVALFVSGRRAPHCTLAKRSLHDLPEDELVTTLAEFGATPGPFLTNPAWRDYVLPSLRADLSVSDRYPPKREKPLRCPIRAFRGAGDRITSETEMRAWSEHTAASFQFETLPGGHFFTPEGRTRVIEAILSELAGQGLIYREMDLM